MSSNEKEVTKMEFETAEVVGRIWLWVMIGLIWVEALGANERNSDLKLRHSGITV